MNEEIRVIVKNLRMLRYRLLVFKNSVVRRKYIVEVKTGLCGHYLFWEGNETIGRMRISHIWSHFAGKRGLGLYHNNSPRLGPGQVGIPGNLCDFRNFT